jgi:hypothetical protein
MMSNELALMPVMEMAVAIQRRNQLNTFVKEIMIEGIDFGVVPGTVKPTLLKPGAEKLVTFFGLAPTFEDVGSFTIWDGNEPLFFYRYRCKLLRGGVSIGEGLGSCNSRESKYRWRWVGLEDVPEFLDPQTLAVRSSSIAEFEFAINKRETGGKYGKPASYWDAFEAAIKSGDARQIQRKTQSGKEFPAYEIASTVYRVPNEDIFSQINTIDKMAQKRALVASVLIGVNASEFFTQDLEDLETVEYSPIIHSTAVVMPEVAPVTVERPRQPQPVSQPTEVKSKMTRPMTPEQVKNAAAVKSAKFTGKPSEKQADYAFTSINGLVDKDDTKRHTVTLYLFGKESSKDLTGGECSFLIDWIGAKADNGYTPDENAVKEVAGIIAEYQRLQGQVDMFETEEIVF